VSALDFRPRRVLAVDLDTGRVEYPDPQRPAAHPPARVLVRWLGQPVGVIDVEGDDDEVVAAATGEAWLRMRPELEAVAAAQGLTAPASPADLALAVAHSPLPPSPRPLVTVTIASFRNVEPTLACVRRVLSGSWSPLEVVVVDNDDDAAPLDAAFTAAFGDDPRVRWVHEPRQGLSFARNAGLAAARGEYVVFTDDDVLVDEHWVARLVEAFDAAPGVACVTGAILPAEQETPAQLWLEEYGGYHKGFRREVYDLVEHRRDAPLYPYDSGRFGSGANMAFRANALRALGGFAVDLGAGTPAHGGEDLDVTRRMVSAGHTVVYEPAALMWHRHRRSMEALQRQMFRYGVGLSATVAKWLVEDRVVRADVLRRLPDGVRHVFSPTSRKNEHKTTFPTALTRREQLGILCGPVAYLRSRRRVRRLAAGTPAGLPAGSAPGGAGRLEHRLDGAVDPRRMGPVAR
jgi:GT2 family glycosyltransferase